MWTPLPAVLIAAASVLLGSHYGYVKIPSLHSSSEDETERYSCRPFLPNLFADTPPTTSDPDIGSAVKKADSFFTQRFSQGDIDSLSIAVVTSNGVLFERNFGVTRGNETATSPPTTSHSQYRIASVSKLFAALEGLILEERGVIHW